MGDVVTTAVDLAAKAAEKVAKVNAAAAVLTGVGTLVTAIAALGVKEIVLKAMDNRKN
ncbi:MAG: hypothetical protein NC253_04585 [Ruminococcus sp.]|nr:hypothetical protein [Ruminococcus sp.]MCM1381078.1 hypothetical protein [Muribaculaceae bacterium]MCM1479278.1 hypothetical protein [Muribaculaceae bacterium]